MGTNSSTHRTDRLLFPIPDEDLPGREGGCIIHDLYGLYGVP